METKKHTTENNNHNPAVYCGTWAKYNSGNLGGAWVDLTTFANGSAAMFWMLTCLHSDEPEPELMFTDFENFPEWFYSESMGAGEIDTVLAWWKDEQAKPEEKPDEVKQAWLDTICEDESDRKYYSRGYPKVIRLDGGGFLPLSRNDIDTSFCFGYSSCGQGMTYEEATECAREARTKGYFMRTNLDGIDSLIDGLTGADNGEHDWKVYNQIKKFPAWMELYDDRGWATRDLDGRPLSPTEKARVVTVLMAERAEFVKRLEAWWKRYGPDKLKIWTYWVDE